MFWIGWCRIYRNNLAAGQNLWTNPWDENLLCLDVRGEWTACVKILLIQLILLISCCCLERLTSAGLWIRLLIGCDTQSLQQHNDVPQTHRLDMKQWVVTASDTCRPEQTLLQKHQSSFVENIQAKDLTNQWLYWLFRGTNWPKNNIQGQRGFGYITSFYIHVNWQKTKIKHLSNVSIQFIRNSETMRNLQHFSSFQDQQTHCTCFLEQDPGNQDQKEK